MYMYVSPHINIRTYVRMCVCLYMQFFKNSEKDLSLSAVQSVNVGQKDYHRSLFSLWKEVFQLPSAKKCVQIFIT